ncbi:hypothetical protein GCM10010372_50970 [Streptomyces tauricus]|uniref:hypothetical protein n=1 Tax=Streptomyces tauricus TaxID=68274 RepID=UPI001671D87E|nr:hypothetical protein [Streptomyces tauricus]GHA44843.1 hypothetical protein GCM10010372_50970 [Streptomyces tauricus]
MVPRRSLGLRRPRLDGGPARGTTPTTSTPTAPGHRHRPHQRSKTDQDPADRQPPLADTPAEPKWDGFRAGLSVDIGQAALRSRRGTQMRPTFPEVVTGAAQLPDATVLRSSPIHPGA